VYRSTINVTLLFSREQYIPAAEAFVRGIERRIHAGLNPNIGSVASLFISTGRNSSWAMRVTIVIRKRGWTFFNPDCSFNPKISALLSRSSRQQCGLGTKPNTGAGPSGAAQNAWVKQMPCAATLSMFGINVRRPDEGFAVAAEVGAGVFQNQVEHVGPVIPGATFYAVAPLATLSAPSMPALFPNRSRLEIGIAIILILQDAAETMTAVRERFRNKGGPFRFGPPIARG